MNKLTYDITVVQYYANKNKTNGDIQFYKKYETIIETSRFRAEPPRKAAETKIKRLSNVDKLTIVIHY